jgi:hypothetical protein
MGTDSTVANMVDSGSRTAVNIKEMIPWTAVWTSFPLPTMETLSVFHKELAGLKIHPDWRYLLEHSRPLFSTLFLSKLIEANIPLASPPSAQDVENAARAAMEDVFSAKKEMTQKENGRFGQLAFYSNILGLDRTRILFVEDVNRLLACHFAWIKLNSGTILWWDVATDEFFTKNENGNKERLLWRSYYPNPEQDILLHIFLRVVRFRYKSEQRHTWYMLTEACYERHFSFTSLYRNASAQKLNGEELEFAATVAMCVAARDLAGTAWKEFIRRLYMEVSDTVLPDNQLAMLPDIPDLKDVPFFASTNVEWPPALKIEGAKLGSLLRVKDGEQVDIRSDDGRIVAECKSHTDGVSNATLKKVYDRIKEKTNCRLFLIFITFSNLSENEPEPISQRINLEGADPTWFIGYVANNQIEKVVPTHNLETPSSSSSEENTHKTSPPSTSPPSTSPPSKIILIIECARYMTKFEHTNPS